MKILVINGPNLNMLGTREPEIYGSKTYKDLCEYITSEAQKIELDGENDDGVVVEFYQSNVEGEIINKIHAAQEVERYDGIVINPGAYTHYSYAIRDALEAVSACVPAVEVHISNVHKREEFRHTSVTAPACVGQVVGMGFFSYIAAIKYLTKLFGGENGRD